MDMNNILNDWTHADDYLDKKYESTKTFVDNMIAPEFIVDENEVSTKVVPEDCSKAVVSMIGGKTVKSKNLIPFPYWRPSGYTRGGATFTCDDDGVITITTGADGVTGNCYFSITRETAGHVAPVVSGKTYTLRATSNVETSNVRFDYKYFNKSTGTERDGGVHKEVNNTITFVYEPQENEVILIQVYCNIGAKPNGEVIKIQLEEGSKPTEYEPYFEGLHSAVVNKITSKSQYTNLFDGEYYLEYPDSTDGTWIVASNSFSVKVPVEASKTYYVVKPNKNGNRFRLWMYADRPEIGSIGIRKLADSNTRYEATVTVKEGEKYIGLFVSSGSSLIKPDIYIGELPYEEYLVQYYKKEVSIPQDILNLPDYGIEGNYIDFEEMKYHHINKTNSDGSDIEPLTTPEVIDLSDIIPPFAVKPKGTIEFVNEHNLDVPNTILYQKEVL